MKKIIIRTPNFIGDTINTTPCLELIKQEYPEAEFTIVGPDFVRELFKYDPRILIILLSRSNGRKNYLPIGKLSGN